MPIGVLGVWSLTATSGQAIVVRAGESITTNSFAPWVRLYGPNGALLGSNDALGFGEVAAQATNSGTFLVVIANPCYSDYGSGTYQMTVNGLSDGFKACLPAFSGTNAYVGGIGGPPGTNVVLYTTTNVATPGPLWTPIVTNQFDQFGVVEYTNRFGRAERQRCFRLSHP